MNQGFAFVLPALLMLVLVLGFPIVVAVINSFSLPDGGWTLENYTKLIENSTDERPALLHATSQLRAAENRLRSFYSPDNRDVNVDTDARYFVCRFCGYLDTDSPPEKCPICGASSEAFQEII